MSSLSLGLICELVIFYHYFFFFFRLSQLVALDISFKRVHRGVI